MQPSSLPVDRRARRAKTDMIDAEMLLRTFMAWLRGEPRVCSMVPIPSEVDEEARRAHREREDLTGERRSIVNKIGGILATLVFTCRRLARTGEPARRNDSILLPVEIGAMAAPSGSEAARPSRPATSGRRTRSGVIEIELGSGSRVRVDNNVDADALRRVLSVLGER